MRSLSIGATGMLAQQTNVDVISNNIANLNTTSYKRQRADFEDLLYENQRRPGATSSDSGTIVPSGIQIGAGVKTGSVYRINEQGALSVTNNSLDVAINGNGFFQVTMPDGSIAYSRAGSFQLNAQGIIVNSDGYQINPGITVPNNATAVTIDSTGQVSVSLSNSITPSIVGQFQLANFANVAGLEATGNNLLKPTPASGDATTAVAGAPGFGVIVQGSLETSNVNIVTELTNLISAQRAYEMNSKIIKTSDEMMSTVAQMST